MRCPRCGRTAADTDKYCAECGMFLRDAFVDHRLLHALWHQQEGRNKEARQELQRLVEAEPEHVLASHILGSMYYHQGTLDQAIEYYQRALELAPKSQVCAYDLGVAWFHRGNVEEAIKVFLHCLELNPNYNAAHYRLGICYFHVGRLDEALEHFEKCGSLTPEYLMSSFHIGVIHQGRGDLDAAAREFERDLDGLVGNAARLCHLAQIRREQGRIEEAEELFKQAGQFGDDVKWE